MIQNNYKLIKQEKFPNCERNLVRDNIPYFRFSSVLHTEERKALYLVHFRGAAFIMCDQENLSACKFDLHQLFW